VERPAEGPWFLRGCGKFEPGESPEECVRRELREESGLTIENTRLRGLLMFPGFKGGDWYVFVLTATEFDGELKENGEGFLKWIPDEALVSLPQWPSDHIFFQWLLEEKFFSAKFIYVGEEMKGYEVTIY